MTSRVEADLHCHTTASDGLLTPREVVRLAAHIGLLAVGITDHDTLSGWSEAEEIGVEVGVEVLRGIELNTDWHGTEVHILGYELNADSSYLRGCLEELRAARERRMLDIIARLMALGIRIQAEQVRKLATGEAIGRPHVAQALVDSGYAFSIRDAFDRYIGQGAPAYVPRYKITPEEGIRLIREAKGVAVLAHPGVHQLEGGIPAWVENGLQGLEVSHSEHGPEEERRYREIAQRFELLMTGGSDFHGEGRKPGVELGGWGVPIDVVDRIRDLAK
ncbi:MAG: PHP domain-containing protein [Desulfitobacteriaceae bacterium]